MFSRKLLKGKVNGLSFNTGGGPRSGSTIRFRGGSSLNASNDPLIVIDDPLIVIDGLSIDNNAVGNLKSIFKHE